VLFHGGGDSFDLHCHDGKYFQINTIKLIETTPKSGLAESFKYLGHIFVLMLIWTVSNDHPDSQSSSHIFDSFCFSSSGGSGWCSSVEHTHSLCQSNIASICKWSDTQSFFRTNELIRIITIPICDGNNQGVQIWFPVQSSLLLPLKVVHVFTFYFVGQISLMHLDRHQCFYLSSI